MPDTGERRRGSDSALSSESLMVPMMERIQEQTDKALDLRASRTDEEMAAIVKSFDILFAERDRLYMSKFDSQKEAVAVALDAANKETKATFEAAEKAIAAANASAKEAILKSEIAQAELNKATYVSIQGLGEKVVALMPRDEAVIRFDNQAKENRELRAQVQELRDRLNRSSGQKEGGIDMRTAIIAFATVFISIVIVVMNLIT